MRMVMWTLGRAYYNQLPVFPGHVKKHVSVSGAYQSTGVDCEEGPGCTHSLFWSIMGYCFKASRYQPYCQK
ncbi:hypothetical protein ECP_3846 [Escherichia coli 536]|uniref:Uncharacterized protein n=1 Tax=Escherichia coli O6:K15:H31 (strain 536 / UPEC) TaxID=362663 RepID=A0A454A9F6_ECOL5|nr:hypothetical protein ECP_3846 [Escherichia coli 536]